MTNQSNERFAAPQFSQQRHISLAPFRRERNGFEKNSSWKLFVDVRFDIHSSLEWTTTKAETDTTNTNNVPTKHSTNQRIVSPFPKQIIRILTKYGATRILLQSGSSSSSAFPSTPFDVTDDLVPAIEHQDHRYRNNRNKKPHLGPAGVSVRVQLLSNRVFSDYEEEHDDDGDDDENADILSRFLGLIQEMVDHRWILASLDMITTPRLHRIIFHTQQLQQQQQQQERSQPNRGNVTTRGRTFELESILPMDGSAVSAEGVDAFFFGPSNTCPSPNPSEDWTTSLAWSSILLGTSIQPPVSTLSSAFRRRRSMWLDLQSSRSCHDGAALDVDKPDEPCRMTIDQGMQYAVMMESKPVSSASTGQQQPQKKKKKQNRISLDHSLLPVNLLKRFGWCHQQSTSTRLELVVPEKWNVTWPSFNSSSTSEARLVWSSHQATATSNEKQTMQKFLRRSFAFDGLDMLLSLPQRSWLTVRPPPIVLRNANDKNMILASMPPVWTVDRTLRRPRGVAMDGILQTVVRHNPRGHGDMMCSTGAVVVEVVEAWPNYIRPRWRTLNTKSATTTGLTVHDSKGRGLLQDIPIRPSDIQQTNDGSIMVKWRLPLPPDTSFSISVYYDYVLLNFEDFPADPNRGMELPPTIATFYCTTGFNSSMAIAPLARLYSDALLIMPPVPDMSMPFNILSLTSTLYAFCIGGLVNLLVRKSSERIRSQYEAKGGTSTETTKASLRDRLRDKLRQSKLGKLIWRSTVDSSPSTATVEPTDPSSELTPESTASS